MDHRALERISMQGWPCLKEETFDGWTLRFADGYTKRANAVYPLGHSTLPLAVKVSHCENVYRNVNLPVIFKVPEGSDWVALDHYLEGQGYSKMDEASVQVLELGAFTPALRNDLKLEWSTIDEWLNVFYRFQHGPSDPGRIFAKMLTGAEKSLHPVLLKSENDAVACGLVSAHTKTRDLFHSGYAHTYFGLFDLVVKPESRGQGYGRWLMNAILDWCKSQGGTRAYLQVMKKNEQARRMYAAFGFVEEYKYWYRVKEATRKGDPLATVVQ